MDNMIENRTHEYDEKLVEDTRHYKINPHMIPFIGKYWGLHGKLLIIAESHYLPELTKEPIQVDYYINGISKYEMSDRDILQKWTTTSAIVNDRIKYFDGYYKENKLKGKSLRIFRVIHEAIIETGFKPANRENVLSFISFMNFFQRPVNFNERSIRARGIDICVANETLDAVIRIIKPEYLFFVSNKAWEFFDERKFARKQTGYSCHPLSKFWNIKGGKYTRPNEETISGKESFKYFIKNAEIFK
jgi:hypothetical protein